MRKIVIAAVALLIAGMLTGNAQAAPLTGCCHRAGVWMCGMACGHSSAPSRCCKMYGRWHCPCPATALAANASGGVHFALDVARLSAETQAEIGLRTLKLARGGAPANREAKRMVAEKGIAFADAAATLASGGSMNKIVRRVRSRVSKNRRRFSALRRGA